MSEFFNRTRGRNRSASITRRRCGWERRRNGSIVPMDELDETLVQLLDSYIESPDQPEKALQEKETHMKCLYYLLVKNEEQLWETTDSKDDDDAKEENAIPKTYRICSICLEAMNDKNVCVQVPTCKHIYHKDCIFSWSKHRNTCPLCVQFLPVYQKVHPQIMYQKPILLEHVDIDDDLPDPDVSSLLSTTTDLMQYYNSNDNNNNTSVTQCIRKLWENIHKKIKQYLQNQTPTERERRFVPTHQSFPPLTDPLDQENDEPSEMAIDIVRHRTATDDRQLAIHALKLFRNDITQASVYIHEMQIAIGRTRNQLQNT